MQVEFGFGQYYLYRHIRQDYGVPFYIGIGKIKPEALQSNLATHRYKRAYEQDNRTTYWKRIKDKAGITVEIIMESNSSEFIKTNIK